MNPQVSADLECIPSNLVIYIKQELDILNNNRGK